MQHILFANNVTTRNSLLTRQCLQLLGVLHPLSYIASGLRSDHRLLVVSRSQKVGWSAPYSFTCIIETEDMQAILISSSCVVMSKFLLTRSNHDDLEVESLISESLLLFEASSTDGVDTSERIPRTLTDTGCYRGATGFEWLQNLMTINYFKDRQHSAAFRYTYRSDSPPGLDLINSNSTLLNRVI